MENVFMIVGFLLAAYSVVANDAIQTLGTFLSANRDKKWWVLWIFGGSILTAVLLYGWLNYGGDVSYGRLSKVGDLPSPFYWWYALPPLVLLIVTRMGIPVSTTFLVLSIFSLAGMAGDMSTLDLFFSIFDFDTKIGKMLNKSLLGYGLAITVGLVVYSAITTTFEKKFLNTQQTDSSKQLWTVLQWASTGFLWSQWLIQDLANIFVYLPRTLSLTEILLSLVVLVGLLGYIFKSNGGEIQKIVTSKTNTTDIRSATIIDFIFALLLYFFKEKSKIPMSTTWVFVGLLAGRELAMNILLHKTLSKEVVIMVLKDLGKVLAGLIVSVLLVLVIHALL